MSSPVPMVTVVALLAEGVDRNLLSNSLEVTQQFVALLAEGVDRNPKIDLGEMIQTGRPPRGGRG